MEYEEGCWARGLERVAGVDEVGVGALAGPVVAAAVVLPKGLSVRGATDSKQLRPAYRSRLFPRIMGLALGVGVGASSPGMIDRRGIRRALGVSMRRAIARLDERPDHIVVDGRPLQTLGLPHNAVVRGDAKVHVVGCASIVAKVWRDRLMRSLSRRYPGYGWERNSGYGTAAHLRAIKRLGLTPHHRVTFGFEQLRIPFRNERPCSLGRKSQPPRAATSF